MNARIFQKSILCFLLFIALGKLVSAQSMGIFNNAYRTIKPSSSSQSVSLSLNDLDVLYGSNEGIRNFYAKKGGYFIKVFLGDAYYGKDNSSALYNLKVTYNIVLESPGGNIVLPETNLIITNTEPAIMHFVDLSKYISNDMNGFSNTATGFSVTKITLQNITLTDNRILPLQSFSGAIDHIRLTLSEEFEFGINIINKEININPVVKNLDKSVTFKWSASLGLNEIPNYEFQLLRLYNTSDQAPYINDETKIYPFPDWNQAMKLELCSNSTTLILTMGEGSGYYAWRVRPIGTLDGGFANSLNWGAWSEHLPNNSPFSLENEMPAQGVFFYDDKDNNINYIYSRVITENNKISENITYATMLNQVKQKQVYNQSDNKTIVQQIILDRSGRPAIQTLPAPYNNINRLAGYGINLVKNNEGFVYNSKDFDLNANYLNPTVMSGNISDYYSDFNLDKTIPNSEQFPFSRTIYADDNTGNVVDVSGMGKTHMIGDQLLNSMGRTTKTTYETASNQELESLFGDEAPAPNTVQKITTTDPNNISTTTYVNLQGKTIATSITYNDKVNPFDDTHFTTSSLVQINADISSNTKINDAFVSSKKFNFFQPTDITEFNYKIKKIEIEQLCAKIDISCAYNLVITISKPGTNEKYYSSVIKIPGTIPPVEGYYNIAFTNADFKNEQGDPISFTAVKGDYIIEKKLTPDPMEENSISIGDPTNGVNLPLENIAKWTEKLKDIYCDQELFNFYNDYYKVAYYFNHYIPGDDEAGGHTPFTEQDRQTDWFAKIFTIDFDKKYKEFQAALDPPYTIIINDKTGGDITPTVYPPTQSAPDIIPDLTILTSKCCTLNINLFYTPDYKCPTPLELKQIREFVDDPANSTKPLNKLFIPDENYLTNMNEIGGKDLTSSGFSTAEIEFLKKIPDFEGYAISMINKARSVGDPTAQYILYYYNPLFNLHSPLLLGWHERDDNNQIKGLFNMMVFKMLTDYYFPDPLGTDDQIVPNPLIIPGQYVPPVPIPNNPCSGNQSEDKLPQTNYKCADIANCWKSIVRQIIKEYCGDDPPLPTENPDGTNVSSGVDKNNKGDQKPHDEHFDTHISLNWEDFIKWLAGRKLSKIMREEVSTPNEQKFEKIITQGEHAVKKFLECTGYQFGDILTYNYGTNPTNTVIANNALNRYASPPYSTHYPYSTNGTNRFVFLQKDFIYTPNSCDYITYNRDRVTNFSSLEFKRIPLSDIFPNIYDPVYTFKYYEWASAILGVCSESPSVSCTYNALLKDFEYSICFNDPNWCVDGNGNRIPCCGWDEFIPNQYKPCNFCEIGTFVCKYTHLNWSNSQRFTYFNKIRAIDFENQLPPNPNELCELTCSEMEINTNWYTPPDGYQGSMAFIPYEPGTIFADFWECETKDAPPPNPLFERPAYSNISFTQLIAQLKTNSCIDKCDERREEFKKEVIKMFTDRCYTIGGCVTDEGNVVPWEDVEEVVNKMVTQCKEQCNITTWRCNDSDCRLWGEANTLHFQSLNPPCPCPNGNTPGQSYTILEWGVGGPNCPSCSTGTGNCSNPLINYNFTYYEYTLNKQARLWFPSLDIRSLCDQTGNYSGISNGGYMYQYNSTTGTWQWLPHIFSGCTPAPIYKTFVPRSDYELIKDPNTINHPYFKVESPKVPIGFTKPD